MPLGLAGVACKRFANGIGAMVYCIRLLTVARGLKWQGVKIAALRFLVGGQRGDIAEIGANGQLGKSDQMKRRRHVIIAGFHLTLLTTSPQRASGGF